MLTGRIIISAAVGGLGINSVVSREAEGQIGHEVMLPAAIAGNLTSRDEDDEGELTLASEHGIETADIIDIYWDGGQRYNVVVGTVAENVVPFSGGDGDILPEEDTAITASKQTTVDTDVDGNLLMMIIAHCGKAGHLSFYADAVLAYPVNLVPGELWAWWEGDIANPLTDKTVTEVRVSQSDLNQQLFSLGALYDSTPPEPE